MSDDIDTVPFAVFCGLDVGKSEHHACALDIAGKRVHDKAPPSGDWSALRAESRSVIPGCLIQAIGRPVDVGFRLMGDTPAPDDG